MFYVLLKLELAPMRWLTLSTFYMFPVALCAPNHMNSPKHLVDYSTCELLSVPKMPSGSEESPVVFSGGL